MSKTTFINAILIDPKSNTLTNGSLTIEDGFIDKINGPSKGNIIDCKNKYLAPGVIDLGVHICEPGERHKESFKSASMAAASGGVTSIVTFPNTIPVIDNPELLEFFMKRARESSKVRILPTAAITKKVEGKEISELSFLQDAGAIAFTNGLKTIKDPKILLRALNYASSLQSLFIRLASSRRTSPLILPDPTFIICSLVTRAKSDTSGTPFKSSTTGKVPDLYPESISGLGAAPEIVPPVPKTCILDFDADIVIDDNNMNEPNTNRLKFENKFDIIYKLKL